MEVIEKKIVNEKNGHKNFVMEDFHPSDILRKVLQKH